MERVMIISSDCHAGIPTASYREYLDAEYRADLDEYDPSTLASENGAQPFAPDATEDREAMAVQCNFMDSDGRVLDLEDTGVVGEVLFPGASPGTAVPWSDFLASGAFRVKTPRGRELQAAGEKAYNRWLAEFCQAAPNRRAGLAFLPIHDVDASVREIEWAKENGLNGVLLPHFNYDLPEFCHGWYWDPIWAACEEAHLSVNFHGGNGLPDFGTHSTLTGLEYLFFSRRPVWHMIFTGVFDRFPGLNVAITEATAMWVPETLRELDAAYTMQKMSLEGRAILFQDTTVAKRTPSEYWADNFFVGASLLSLPEMEHRHEIGVGSMMYGVDYPHPEGTWLHSSMWLSASLGKAGGTEEEARKILGENAAAVYNFDVDDLAPVVERVGPTVDDVLSRASDEETEQLLADAAASGRVLAVGHLVGRGTAPPAADEATAGAGQS